MLERITEYQMGRCILCSTWLDLDTDFAFDDPRRLTFDHVLPRSKGGKNAGNYLIAHQKCNHAKADRMPTGCELVWLAAVNARLPNPSDPSDLSGAR